VDTGTLSTDTPVPIEVPPGSWRRETTHCPQPLSPFFGGAIGLVGETFRSAFSELGALYDTLEYREIGGWIYTQLVPPGGTVGVAAPPELIRRRAELAAEAVRSDNLDTYLEEWQELRSGFVGGVARLRGVDLRVLDDQGLAAHLDDVLGFSVGAFNVHFRLHGINAMMLSDLARTCRDLFGWEDVESLELLCGLSEASAEPATALAGLTAMARERPAVRRFIESSPTDASALSDIDPEFAEAFGRYHEQFGLRTIRYEVSEPSIEETPSLALRLIADQLRSGYDATARASDAARKRQAVQRKARSLLATRSEADRAGFERALRRAERWYGVREEKASLTWSEQFGLIRQVALEIGRRLTARSVLDGPDDVFFLQTEEAVAALVARPGGTGPECRELVRRRRAERTWVEAHPGPLTYGPQPDPREGLDDLPAEMRYVTEAQLWLVERGGHFVATPPQPGGNRIAGVSASTGTYTGTARVLLGEADFDKLQPGAVLVCPITSPAGSGVFPNVGALVTDAGAILSHSAIIAREFQIPAVVATGNATELLRDGQLVRVDGAAGSVEVLA
jgi:phosphohistidine swiveling domain-containing protein